MSEMLEQTVKLASRSGLHARPAAVFVQKAKEFQGEITLVRGEKEVNAKSILSVLSLGGEHGDEVLLRVKGEDAQSALAALVELLERDLG